MDDEAFDYLRYEKITIRIFVTMLVIGFIGVINYV